MNAETDLTKTARRRQTFFWVGRLQSCRERAMRAHENKRPLQTRDEFESSATHVHATHKNVTITQRNAQKTPVLRLYRTKIIGEITKKHR